MHRGEEGTVGQHHKYLAHSSLTYWGLGWYPPHLCPPPSTHPPRPHTSTPTWAVAGRALRPLSIFPTSSLKVSLLTSVDSVSYRARFEFKM